MGTSQQGDPAPRRRPLGSILVAGTIPVAVCLGAGHAVADSPAATPPVVSAETPADATPVDPGEVEASADTATDPEAAPIPPVPAAARTQDAGEQADTAAATDEEPVAADAPAPKVYVGRNSDTGMRAEPENAGLAPVDAQRLHLPNPGSVPDVAPIQAPAGKLRCGDAKVDVPPWLGPVQAGQVNEASARTEAQLARTLDSAGFAPSRSDRIAAGTLGGAATGAVVGAIAGLPPVLPGLVVGTVVGAVIGGVNAYNAPAIEPPLVDKPAVESPAADASVADSPAAAESPAQTPATAGP
ncbi:hypothetical protein [Nocardia aurantia]|uniref:Glycine zipper domain-containing protein n=1 Tax=Nocardia aurantia TaxID=2585199 RepID=A0A7K0DKU6_9NOCA|nr:hypothetical protein [Nocardia aurantia]MQY26288.1 hypothetical protein [Nocardia aurantia]